MRVVLDTNVLVSGIFFQGIPGKIVDAWVDGRFSLFISPSILEEYARVINDLAAEHENSMAFEWMEILAELSHLIPNSSSATPYSRDRQDDKFIECAISAKADYLVTGDKDLTQISETFSFKIITPSKFLAYLLKTK